MSGAMGKDVLGEPGGSEPFTSDGRRAPRELDGVYEFEAGVVAYRPWNVAEGRPGELQARFTVRLPHQCDQWVITENDDPNQAIADVECFIQEAEAALRVLRSEAAAFGRGDAS